MNAQQQDYRANLCKQYEGDAMGFYVAERNAMLSGRLPLNLTSDHLEATKAENKAFLDRLSQTANEAF